MGPPAAPPFSRGSDSWYWYVLICFKPWRGLYDPEQPLLQREQTAKEAAISEAGIVTLYAQSEGGLTQPLSATATTLKMCMAIPYCCGRYASPVRGKETSPPPRPSRVRGAAGWCVTVLL